MHAILFLPRRILAGLVRAYQILISPLLPPSCRFTPSCSQYALEAVQRHGAIKGSWLAARRLARCHPWNPGGYDPVPDPREEEGGRRKAAMPQTADLNREGTLKAR